MEKDQDRIKKISDACEKLTERGEFPSSLNIANEVGIDYHTFGRWLRNNEFLKELVTNAEIEWIKKVPFEKLVESTKQGNGMILKSLEPNEEFLLKKRVIETGLERLKEKNEFPSNLNIANEVGIDYQTVRRWLGDNESLKELVTNAGIEWIEIVPFEKLVESTKKENGMILKSLETEKKFLLKKRVIETGLERLKEKNEFPSNLNIANEVGIEYISVVNWLGDNESLKELVTNAGIEWIGIVPFEKLVESTKKENGMILKSLEPNEEFLLKKRVIETGLERLKEKNEFPGISNIANEIGINDFTVGIWLRDNEFLKELVTNAEIEWINNVPFEKLFESTKKDNGMILKSLETEERFLLKKRIIETGLERLKEKNEFPSITNIANEVGIDNSTIGKWLKNESLNELVTNAEIEWIKKVPFEKLVESTKKENGMILKSLETEEKALVNERFDKFILQEIKNLSEEPSVELLLKKSGMNRLTISNRIEENLELWVAFYTKKGLTEDQAIEFAIERGDKSNAVSREIEKRLKHLYACREMIGVIKGLSEFLEGKILNLSIYPNPLKEAANILKRDLDIAHINSREFLANTENLAKDANVCIIQGIHRLNGNISEIFKKVHETLGTGKKIIATFSKNHILQDEAANILNENGFKIREQGVIEISPPEDEKLLECGTKEEDLERMKEKIKGTSNVLILDTIEKSKDSIIPKLEKKQTEETNNVNRKINGKTIDVPEKVSSELLVKFILNLPKSEMKEKQYPSDPYLIEVIGEEGKTVALIGFGLHPKHLKKAEFARCDESKEKYLEFASKIARNRNIRNELGVKPNEIGKIPLERVKEVIEKVKNQ